MRFIPVKQFIFSIACPCKEIFAHLIGNSTFVIRGMEAHSDPIAVSVPDKRPFNGPTHWHIDEIPDIRHLPMPAAALEGMMETSSNRLNLRVSAGGGLIPEDLHYLVGYI